MLDKIFSKEIPFKQTDVLKRNGMPKVPGMCLPLTIFLLIMIKQKNFCMKTAMKLIMETGYGDLRQMAFISQHYFSLAEFYDSDESIENLYRASILLAVNYFTHEITLGRKKSGNLSSVSRSLISDFIGSTRFSGFRGTSVFIIGFQVTVDGSSGAHVIGLTMNDNSIFIFDANFGVVSRALDGGDSRSTNKTSGMSIISILDAIQNYYSAYECYSFEIINGF